jgi:fatty acid synthase
MTCLRYDIPDLNIRYVFIQDKNSPKFDLSIPFYAEQLNKGLIANVLKGGQWGSYRYLPLDLESNTSSVQVKHAHVDVLTKGDLNTLKWIESPLNYYSDNFSNSRLCSVYYAALNFR